MTTTEAAYLWRVFTVAERFLRHKATISELRRAVKEARRVCGANPLTGGAK